MGGDIKIIQKNGPGTLMQLCLLLGTSTDKRRQQSQVEVANHGLVVVLALSGPTGRSIMSHWLDKKQVRALLASDWNELTQMLRRIFQDKSSFGGGSIDIESQIELFSDDAVKVTRTSQIVIIVDIDLLDLSTNIWKEQLNCIGRYAGKARFAWILNHDTPNSVKMELRRKGHLLMINKPLYKSKMIQILAAVTKERNLELQNECESSSTSTTISGGDMHDCLDVDPINYDGSSSEDFEKRCFGCPSSGSALQLEFKKREGIEKSSFSQLTAVNNYLLEFDEDNPENIRHDNQKESKTSRNSVQVLTRNRQEKTHNLNSDKNMNEQKSLEGLKILLAEDMPILQRVTSIMLEKVGARVMVVGDGLQAVNALKDAQNAEESSPKDERISEEQRVTQSFPPFDLILMDCQMPKMDGYEATKEIRRLESGTGIHIPIVALTAHAMSSDQAKCLDVGMDAYLTKPIDYKLMISTILSLTKEVI